MFDSQPVFGPEQWYGEASPPGFSPLQPSAELLKAHEKKTEQLFQLPQKWSLESDTMLFKWNFPPFLAKALHLVFNGLN